ncbi:hypothetical protein GGR56DRAFT_448422 [Xylariaceae sp. FL0804]|nr:hypothetical protein GGR56DRAFT_448422 [Xylariaceae sp. FL0804]
MDGRAEREAPEKEAPGWIIALDIAHDRPRGPHGASADVHDCRSRASHDLNLLQTGGSPECRISTFVLRGSSALRHAQNFRNESRERDPRQGFETGATVDNAHLGTELAEHTSRPCRPGPGLALGLEEEPRARDGRPRRRGGIDGQRGKFLQRLRSRIVAPAFPLEPPKRPHQTPDPGLLRTAVKQNRPSFRGRTTRGRIGSEIKIGSVDICFGTEY